MIRTIIMAMIKLIVMVMGIINLLMVMEVMMVGVERVETD